VRKTSIFAPFQNIVMLLYKQVIALQHHLRQSSADTSVGFVPTMGALHRGHLELVRHSRRENELTVCSIFVNPTQFNEAGDLASYPHTESKDVEALLKVGCEVVFMPTVEEVYPAGTHVSPSFDFGQLDQQMEGAFRPGHFDGVAQVVHRLLEIVKPDRLYMGQKDLQQFLIIESMIGQASLPVQLVRHPIVREADGLAMSSRNMRLTPDSRAVAPRIFQVLKGAKEDLGRLPVSAIQEKAMKILSHTPPLRPEYFELVDGTTLEPVKDPAQHNSVVACTAVWAGDVRLIDNHFLKEERK
jgi:pantoate--beta-alanine ligase